MSLYTHWVCFDCRKSFHKIPTENAWKCPDCSEELTDMGIYFEPPRRQAVKKWEVMQLLANNGYKFQTEGSKFYIDNYILGSKNPSVKSVRETINFQAKEKAGQIIKERLDWEKKFWRK